MFLRLTPKLYTFLETSLGGATFYYYQQYAIVVGMGAKRGSSYNVKSDSCIWFLDVHANHIYIFGDLMSRRNFFTITNNTLLFQHNKTVNTKRAPTLAGAGASAKLDSIVKNLNTGQKPIQKSL